jgi:hypothetical protein
MLVYKYDLSTNQETLVCGYSFEAGLPQEVDSYDWVTDTGSYTYVVNDYFCVTSPFEQGSYVQVVNLSSVDLSQPIKFTNYQTEFVFNPGTSYIATDDYLVCVGARRVGESGDASTTAATPTPTYTVLFDPATGQVIGTQAVLSGEESIYARSTIAGDTLYVWTRGASDLSNGTEHFRSLSLAQWLGGESAADSESDVDMAPSVTNAEGEAAASVLADTSDKTGALALEAVLALSLVTCAAAALKKERA